MLNQRPIVLLSTVVSFLFLLLPGFDLGNCAGIAGPSSPVPLPTIVDLESADLTTAHIKVYLATVGGGADVAAQEINAAQKTIWLESTQISSVIVAQALLEAHRRGVKVTVVMDHFNLTSYYQGRHYTILPNIATFIILTDDLPGHSTMIIDGEEVLTGVFPFSSPEDRGGGALEIIKGVPKVIRAYESVFNFYVEHARLFTRYNSDPHASRAEEARLATETLTELAHAMTVNQLLSETRHHAAHYSWGLDILWPVLQLPANTISVYKGATVTIGWDFDREGKPVNIHVDKSSGNSDIDEAAKKAIEDIHYRPFLLDDEPQVAHISHTFNIGEDTTLQSSTSGMSDNESPHHHH